MIDYFHFVIKKEFVYPTFNGHIANVFVSAGPTSFLNEEQFGHHLISQQLDESLHPSQLRVTVEQNHDVTDVNTIEAFKEPVVYSEEHLGVHEYAVSGWAKWV